MKHAPQIGNQRPNIMKTLSLLFGYIKNEKSLLAITITLTLLLTGLSLTIPKIISETIDWIGRIPSEKSVKDVFLLIALLLVLYLFQVVLSYFEEVKDSKLFLEVASRMRVDYLRKITNISIGYLDTCRQGDLLSRGTNDIETVVKLLSETLLKFISTIVLFVGSLAIMLVTSWQLTIICLVSTVVTFVTSGILSQFIRKHSQSQQMYLGKLNSFLEDCLSIRKSIKLYNREKTTINKFSDISNQLKEESVHTLKWLTAVMPINNFIGNLNFMIIAVVGGILATSDSSTVTVATIILFILYVREYTETLNDFSELFSEAQVAITAAERFFEILNDAPEELYNEAAEPIRNGRINLADVHFSYIQGKEVLSGINMYIEAGQNVAITGVSGCGKTTLVQLLLGFYSPDSGRISIDDKIISKISLCDLRKNIVAVMQDDIIFDENLTYNISYGAEDNQDISVSDFVEALNLDLESVPIISHLSKGQIQKICVMRALMSRAKIIILDESMSLVDPITYMSMFKRIQELFPKATIISVTHQVSYLKDCDKIFFISDGKVTEEGAFQELINQKGAFYKMIKINE